MLEQDIMDPSQVWSHIINQDHYEIPEIKEKILSSFQEEQVNFEGKSVLFKVSFVLPVKDPQVYNHIITNPLLIAASCQAFAELGARVIYIAESQTIGCARFAFNQVGMKKAIKQLPLTSQKIIHFVYLDECKKDWISPITPIIPNICLDYPRIVKNVDIFVSIFSPKTNIFSSISLSVKNLVGLIDYSTRLKYHNNNLHGCIADLYQIRPPDYVIADAVMTGEGQGPIEATPHSTNLIIIGNNGIAVDSICCSLMGYNPREIQHIKMLYDLNYGPIDISSFRIIGKDEIPLHKANFLRPSRQLDQLTPYIHCFEGTTCESGCPAQIRHLLDGYGLIYGWNKLGKIWIVLGKNPQVSESDLVDMKQHKRSTIIFGECAKKFRKYGIYYGGCAPDHIWALKSFIWKTSLGFSGWIKYMEYLSYFKNNLLHWLNWFHGKSYSKINNFK